MSWCDTHKETYYGGSCDECTYDTLPKWTGKVPAESKRQTITVTVYECGSYGIDGKTAIELYQWWKEKLEDVPAKYIPLATLDITSEQVPYEDHYETRLYIKYRRPENAAEYRRRKASKKYSDDKQRLSDRAQLERLQKKLKGDRY